MESRLALFSIVVTGESHNPTILNPNFLHIRDIVPQEWEGTVKVAQTITTPPFAVVAYENGISVVVENEKLQVVDTSLPADPSESVAVRIANKYVLTLPHVRYKAVGVNFHSVIGMDSPREFLKKRFIKTGPWDSESDPLAAAGVRFLYSIPDGGRVVFDLDAGEQKTTDKKVTAKPVAIVKANFQRECKEYPGEKEVVGHLGHIKEDWSRYQQVLKMLFEQEA